MPRTLLLTLALLALPAVARAQFNPYAPGQSWPYPTYYGRQGGTLAGGAQFLQSQGNVLVQQEQARITRQQAEQEKLKTKRMAFDQMMYEKANTPSFTEEQEKVDALRLRRMMTQPNRQEIIRGDTLNAMLPALRPLADQGTQGPPAPLSPYVLRDINVSGSDGRGVGVLRDGGKVRWPIALRGEGQKKLDTLLPTCVARAVDGTLDAKLLKEVRTQVARLSDDLRTQFHKEQIDSTQFLAGKRFMEDLTASVQALERPDVARYFDGTFTAQGHNVPELVNHMTLQGLRFAPASPGQESAYNALHNSFVAFAQAAGRSTGFQTTLAPTAATTSR